MIHNFKKKLMVAFFIYLSLAAFIYIMQRDIQYMPFGKIEEPQNYGLSNIVEDYIITSDNVKIYSWSKFEGKNNKVIIYFHGNAGNLGDRYYRFKTFADSGYDFIAISYRGYVNSQGSASEKGLINDGLAAINYAKSKGYKNNDIILYGESLGSGVAIQLAARSKYNAVILESPYSSILSVARTNYWFLPVKLMLKDKFMSINYAPNITTPVIIFHGKKDKIVRYEEGVKLYNSINAKKKFISDDNLGHVQFDPEFVIKEYNNFNKINNE
jgi:uncharacterized protein